MSRYGGHWIRARRRWSLYLRDGLRCVYCLRGLEDLLDDDEFLTLDHVSGRGSADHGDENVVACCFGCNTRKGSKTLTTFAAELGIAPSTLRTRIMVRRRKGTAPYKEAAAVLLGMLDGVPRAAIVDRNDWLAKYHFRADDPEFEHLRGQVDLFCPACGRAHVEEPFPF